MKRFVLTVVGVAVLICLAACGCKHEWVEATCDAPKTCLLCQEVEGEALEHDWSIATCVEPSKCSLCGETLGEPMGHIVMNEPVIAVEPTLDELGELHYMCSRCDGVAKTEVAFYYDITADELKLYNNVLNTFNSLKTIHLVPESFELLGASVQTIGGKYRTTIYMSYKGLDGKKRTEYFWKDLNEKDIMAVFGEDNYYGRNSGGADTLDLEEILYYAECGAYKANLVDEKYISTSKKWDALLS